MMIVASECVSQCSMLHQYTGLMTDVPHIAFEFTLEIISAPVIYVFGKWMARREHRKIDAEHGVDHRLAQSKEA